MAGAGKGEKCVRCGKPANPKTRRDCCGKTHCKKCLMSHFEEAHKAVK